MSSVGFIFCSLGRIMMIIIGILNVICVNNIDINLSFILIMVNRIKKDVLIIISGFIINILLNVNSVFWICLCFIYMIVSVFIMLIIVEILEDSRVIIRVFKIIISKCVFWNIFLY